MSGWLRALPWLLPMAAVAAPWEFGAPLDVDGTGRPGVFHQFDAGARQHLAVAGETVALVWEDNRDGSAQTYVAFKNLAASAFTVPRRVSAGRAASEPAIVALDAKRFLIAWEQDGAVWVRQADDQALGVPLKLADLAGQVSVSTVDAESAYAAWSERREKFRQIRLARLRVDPAGGLVAETSRAVDGKPLKADQLYPSVAATRFGAMLAWEDRRRGHTALLYSALNERGQFMPPRILNDQLPQRSQLYGKGTGVARVGLARYGGEAVAAVWLDKRDFEGGYDIYSARTPRGGKNFGPNRKVQDEFGDSYGQWHAAIAGHGGGQLAVVWDDDRDDSADVWLAWPVKDGWSENLAVPGASSPGQQTQPVLTFDAVGDLHLAWIERDSLDAPTRLRYLHAKRSPPAASAVQDK
jgi:hypothetical protein